MLHHKIKDMTAARITISIVLLFSFCQNAFSQNTGVLISELTGTPDVSAILEARSTRQGFLPPRLTQSQRNSILTPATGLLIFQTDNTPGYYYNAGTPASPQWELLINNSNAGVSGTGAANQVTYWTGTNTISGDAGFTYDGTNLSLSSGGNFILTENASEVQFPGSVGPHGLNFVNGEAVLYYRTVPNNLLIEDASANPIFSADIDDQQVGIGTDEPADKLHVLGSIRMVDGNQSAGYVPVSDANGTMVWTDPTTITTADDGDWVTVGSDIERQSGDVYIGNTSGTDNALYFSDDLIDWDNTSYIIDPSSDASRFNEITFDAGSLTDPSIRFDGDANSGIYQPSADNLAFSTGGTEVLRIDENSHVGIGTTDPQGTLEVIGDIWATSSSDNALRLRTNLGSGFQYGFADNYGSGIAIINEQGSTNQALFIGDSDSNDATTLLGLSTGGSVNNPSTGDEAGWQRRFEVLGDGTVKLNSYTSNGLLAVSGGDGTVSIATGSDLPSGSNLYIQNQNSADQVANFRINGDGLFNGGNVGIGTTAPSNPLHIYDTQVTLARFEQSTSSGANALIEIKGARNACTTCHIAAIDLKNYDSNDNGGTEYTMARIYGGMDADDGSKGYLAFLTNDGTSLTERARINEAGIMGINISSPGITPSSDGQTSTPNLHILNNEAIANDAEVLRLERYDGSDIKASTAGHIGFYINDNNSGGGEVARISWQDGQPGDSDGEGTGELHFWTSETSSANGVPVQRMTINKLGNVGIGTTTPVALLEVEGDLRVTGENSKVEFNTKEVNNGWTLIYRDDFQSSDDGWAMYENNNSSTVATGEYERESWGIIGVSTCLNNHSDGTSDDTDNNNVFKKLYDMSGVTWTEAQITFDYIFIDSWDGRERGYAGVASSLTGNPTILWVEDHDNNDDANGRIAFSFAGSSEGDHVKTAMMHVRNDVISGGDFILIIGSTLDEDRSNESFGIDNIEVWVR